VQARGDGPLFGQGKFPLMPSLVAPPATERADGYVYGVIRAGRGLMPAYGSRMTHTERWAVVAYVNSLQQAAGVQPQPAPQQPEAPAAAGASPAAAPGAPPQPAPQPAAPPQDTVPQGTTPATDTVLSQQES
jgi:hypothetical protein